MYELNGWDAVLQHFSALSPTCHPTWWKFATQPRELECGHCEVEKRQGQPSVAASCGCVARLSAGPYAAPWDDSRPGCLGRKTEKENKKKCQKLEELGVSCLRGDERC